jgi:ATP-dependent helicase/nuclease subunit A
MNFTPEQHAAIFTHDRNLIVTAGAGSGKTRVLVERFTALLDANPDWTLPSVVAITFTEKAAREMRDRVRAAIEDKIAESIARQDETALDRWLDHQAALNRARIGTIHALCTHLLRANPAEAGVDPAFDVLDENEAAILLDDAVDQALARLGETSHPAAALLALYDVRTVRRVLRAFAEHSKAQAVHQALDLTPDALFARWEQDWQAAMQDVMNDVTCEGDLCAALDYVGPRELPPGDKLSDIWRIVHAHRDALFGSDPVVFSAAVTALAGGIDLRGGSANNWGSKEHLDESKAALRLIREWMQAIQKIAPPCPGERDAFAADLLVLWGTVIALTADTYAALKRDRAALDFDDLETLARNLLDRHPEVAARYASEFRHVLVDEFQDTNDAQRAIVYALTGVQQTGSEGRLFVVGDPKQSIYAFRGADVSVFGQVRDDLIGWGGDELPLSTSFRTHDRLVAVCNDLFERILQVGGGSTARYEVALGQPLTAFRPAEPDHLPHQTQPLALIALHRPDEDLDPERRFNADEMRRWEAWEIAQHIHRLVDDHTLIWDRNRAHDESLPPGSVVPDHAKTTGRGAYRPMHYGDVAILFQAMTRAPLYEEVFKAADLPYTTVAGKGYYDRQEVWDLLNLLRALHNPADDLALAVALRSPLFGLSDDALYALRLARDESEHTLPLWDALMVADPPFFPPDDRPARDFAWAILAELHDLAGRVPIADLLTRALNLTGYPATLTGLADGARRRGNVEKLLALARESGRISLGAFNAYARELTAREVREGEAAVEVEGAVTLMSVHASKGLEFPIVMLADTSWERSRRSVDIFTLDPEIGAACKLPTDDPEIEEPESFAWQWAATLAERRDRAERRRLLYVGATRAQDLLIVSGSLYRCGAQTWLRQWLDALGLADDDLVPADEPQIARYEWGDCVLVVPRTPPALDVLTPRVSSTVSGWDIPVIRALRPAPDVDPILPPLLAAVPADPTAPARALTATQIARLGQVPFYDPTQQGRAAFRHSVLHDMPEPVRPLPDRRAGPQARTVGSIVHRALQVWLLPDNTDPDHLRQRLAAFAWELDVSDPVLLDHVVRRALDLLGRFANSPIRHELEKAQQIYRELPFVWNNGTRTIHGVIDVLYFDGRTWHILDYKTTPVSWERARENAQQYYLQLGVYAAAVEAHTGQAPEMHMYYIHPARLLYVKKADWQPALANLEDDLRAALDIKL